MRATLDRIQRLANRLFNYTGQKYMYPAITRRLAHDSLFLNFGYEEVPPMAIPLEAADEPDRFPIQLYHATAAQTDLRGKAVLEVGCGHGGGASYLTRALHPASYTGLDLNATAIAFCRATHHHAALRFVEGDAQNLPFPDESFDVVVNIESALHYPQFPRFLAEVARVLRPGGHFVYADMRYLDIPEWEAAVAGAQLRTLSHRVINTDVIRGIENYSQHWQILIDRYVPPLLRGYVRSQSGLEGAPTYCALKSGTCSYRMYHMSKVA